EGAARIGSLEPLRAARMLMYAVQVAWLCGDRTLVADAAGRLKTAGGPAAELAPLVQLMLLSARQAADGPRDDDLPELAELVAQARRVRGGGPFHLTEVAPGPPGPRPAPDAPDPPGAPGRR